MVSWSLDLVNIAIFFKVYQGWPPMNCQEIPTKLIWKCKEPCEGWKVKFLKSCVLLLLWPSYVAGDFDQEEKLAATANDASFCHQTFAKMFLSMIHVSYENPNVILEVISIVNHLTGYHGNWKFWNSVFWHNVVSILHPRWRLTKASWLPE